MKKFFTAVIALMMTISVSAQFYIYLSNGEVLQADSISLIGPISGTLSGTFSVSETKKVHFSQGNLQYVGTSWRFAEHQWDTFGESQSDNHRDLFGWGTGNNPNNVSTDYNDYAIFDEWGDNLITNGGNTAKKWRTLTMDEWGYLFFTRTDAATLFGFGSVNDVNGIILLPDNWALPAGASFIASTMQGLIDEGGNFYNPNDDNFSHNTYTPAQWEVMESAGAVFLPAAGYRIGTEVREMNSSGYYWSSTPCYQLDAYILDFRSFNLYPQDRSARECARSARLVR